METQKTQKNQKNIEANILVEIRDAIMHRLVKKQRTVYGEGTVKIAKIESAHESPVYFLNLNSFYYTLTKSVNFAKLENPQSVSYIFSHFDTGLSAISFKKQETAIHNFEEAISNAANLEQFNIAMRDEEFMKKIEQNCPTIDKEMLIKQDKIKSTIETAGAGLESGIRIIGDLIVSSVHFVGQFINNRLAEPSEKTQVPEQTKQKWQKLKNGTNKVFNISLDLYHKFLEPIVNTGIEYSKNINTKMQNSQNKTIRYASDLTHTSTVILGHAWAGLTDSTNKVVNQLQCQSRKIVEKRLGQDYVDTFLPKEKQDRELKEGEQVRTEGGDDEEKQNLMIGVQIPQN